MREALAEALSDFEGAIVMVSHDRHLIGLVCDSFWRVADGVVEPFAGDLDEYAAWLRSRPAAQGTKQKMAEAAPTPPPPTKPLPPKKPSTRTSWPVPKSASASWKRRSLRWIASWPIPATTPTAKRWRCSDATAKQPRSSWLKPRPHGWS